MLCELIKPRGVNQLCKVSTIVTHFFNISGDIPNTALVYDPIPDLITLYKHSPQNFQIRACLRIGHWILHFVAPLLNSINSEPYPGHGHCKLWCVPGSGYGGLSLSSAIRLLPPSSIPKYSWSFMRDHFTNFGFRFSAEQTSVKDHIKSLGEIREPGFRRTDTTSVFRAVNFELFAKPVSSH